MIETPQRQAPLAGGWRAELCDFARFVWRPRLSPRWPRRPMPPLAADWLGGLQWRRALRWVLLLWLCNFLVLGPLAAGAASQAGAEHRFDPMQIPWLLALVWAPIVEELIFRLGMRRPGAALWLLPSFLTLAWYGRDVWVTGFLALSLLLVTLTRPIPRAAQYADGSQPTVVAGARQPLLPGIRWSWRWNRRFVRAFPWVFHLLTLGFAGLHLFNFKSVAAPLWLWPMLVLPQWVTGLALGWLRVRGGMGLAMLVHAGFNAGPLLVVWAVMSLAP